MNTREQMTDLVLEKMSEGKEVTREWWWRNIMGRNGTIPKVGSIKRYPYTSACFRAKESVNIELVGRGKTCRQVFTIHSEGFRLVTKDEVLPITYKMRNKKEVSTTMTSMKKFQNIIDAKDTSESDKINAQKELNYLATRVLPKQLRE